MAGCVRGPHRPGRAALRRHGPGEPLPRRAHRAEPAGGHLPPAAAAATRAPGEGRPRGRRRGLPAAASWRTAATLRLPGAAPPAHRSSGRTKRTQSFPVLYSPEAVSCLQSASFFLKSIVSVEINRLSLLHQPLAVELDDAGGLFQP